MYFYLFMPGFVKPCIVPIMFNFNKGGDEVICKWVAYGISALQDVGSVQKGKMVAWNVCFLCENLPAVRTFLVSSQSNGKHEKTFKCKTVNVC